MTNGLTTIEGYAFSSCLNLTNLFLPATVTDLGANVFRWDNSLTAITVDHQNSFYRSIDGVLFNVDQSVLI